jgi:FG-GAP-like repeat
MSSRFRSRRCFFNVALTTIFFGASLSAFATANNPIPQVVGPPVPQAVVPGSGAFTLTVYGANFVSGASVNWNRQPRITTYISARELQAKILASDVANPTAGYITVTNPPPGGGISSSSYGLVEVHTPTKTIVPGSNRHYGQQPDGQVFALVAADFNGDGVLDLLRGDAGDKLRILLGDGDGNFHFGSLISHRYDPETGIAFGDFNADGALDLIFLNGIFDKPPFQVQASLGEGNGKFRLGSRFEKLGPAAPQLAVGDFNRDGKLDLIYEDLIFLGNGDGTFRARQRYTTGGNPFSVVAGDFNGDGTLDLVVERFNGVGYEIDIALGKGDGTFKKARQVTTVSSPSAVPGVLASDFNRDGNLDLTFLDGQRIVVLIGKGDGTFHSPASYSAFGAFATGDFNSDGNTDLLVNGGDGYTFLLLGNGDGTFKKARKIDGVPDSGTEGIVVGDFNSDGLLDFVFQEGGWGMNVHLQK